MSGQDSVVKELHSRNEGKDDVDPRFGLAMRWQAEMERNSLKFLTLCDVM